MERIDRGSWALPSFHIAYRLCSVVEHIFHPQRLMPHPAQRLLIEGMPPAQVACATGFADQSHLTHRFKRCIGVTPGRYARQRKIVQDGAMRGPYAGAWGAG